MKEPFKLFKFKIVAISILLFRILVYERRSIFVWAHLSPSTILSPLVTFLPQQQSKCLNVIRLKCADTMAAAVKYSWNMTFKWLWLEIYEMEPNIQWKPLNANIITCEVCWRFLHIAFFPLKCAQKTKYGFIIIARYSLAVTISSIQFEIGKNQACNQFVRTARGAVQCHRQTFRCYQISIVYKIIFHLDVVQWFEHWNNTWITWHSSGEVWRSL